jgi:hypothetical protein
MAVLDSPLLARPPVPGVDVRRGAQEEHALLVRRINGTYQIIPGWYHWITAGRVQLAKIPRWVKDMDDDEACMQLVLCKAQGELYPLKLDIHVLQAVAKGGKGRGTKGGMRAYAEQVGKAHNYLTAFGMRLRSFE